MSINIINSAETRILLVGNPNSGKSLFFNKLTGENVSSSNYPGTTFEVKTSKMILNDQLYQIIDLPGIYDLQTGTDEEIAASQFLTEHQGHSKTIVLFFLDATRLDKGIYLLSQVLENELTVITLLTHFDIAKKHQLNINQAALEEKLGTKIISTSNLLDDSRQVLSRALAIIQSDQSKCIKKCERCNGCIFQQRHQTASQIASEVCQNTINHAWTERLDNFFLHPLLGSISFLIVAIFFFWTIFFIASWPMDWIDQTFTWLGQSATDLIPAGWIQDLIVNGLLSGLNGIVIFVPQIFILFFMLNLLDNSGYLARIVCIMDRLLRKFGLPGTAFIPILSAHACAIPAILATKVIKSRRERLLAIFIIPFFSCSARLPVYVMLTALLFPDSPMQAALIFVSCYLSGALLALLTAAISQLIGVRHQVNHLLLELPAYRRPPLRLAWQEAKFQSLNFIKKAGSFILIFSLIIWLLSSFPAGDLENSYLGKIGNFIQPIFEPLGFDWQITVGIISSFAAREVIVATFAIIFNSGDQALDLTSRLQAATNSSGGQLFDFSTSLSLLVFFIFALQCFPTLITSWKESGSKKFAILQFVYASAIAYGLAWIAKFLAS